MTLVVTHNFTSTTTDTTSSGTGGGLGIVGPAEWNANHTLTGVASPAQGGTGITSGTGVTYFSSATVISDSGTLTNNVLIVGGGANGAPTSITSGTTSQVLHGNASGAPSFGAVNLGSEVAGTLSTANISAATTAAFGIVKPDNSTITISSGVITSVTGTVGGANTDVQFNNSGSFGGDSGFTYLGNGQANLALGTVTTGTTALNISGTWNNNAIAFPALCTVNAINTQSVANQSLIAAWQLNSANVMQLDGIGRLFVGLTSAALMGGVTGKITVAADTASTGQNYWHTQYDAYGNDAFGVEIAFGKTRGANQNTHVAVQQNDEIGGIYFYGSDGTNYIDTGWHETLVDGPVTSNHVPTRQVFAVSSITNSHVEVLRIDTWGTLNLQGGTQSIGGTFTPSTTTSTVAISVASPAVITFPSHGFVPGQVVQFGSNGGTLPTNITSGTNYYVTATGITTNTFQISTTLNGASVNSSGTPSGTPTLTGQTLAYGVPMIAAGNSGLTGSQTNAGVTITQNWNTSGVADAALVVNVNNILSGAGSILFDIQKSASSIFNVQVDGSVHLTGGAVPTAFNAGTVASGTFTPVVNNGNYQYYTNGGNHVLSTPAVDGAIDILISNGASPGTITTSGYTVGSNTGDSLTTSTGSKFLFSLRRINGTSTYSVLALQ